MTKCENTGYICPVCGNRMDVKDSRTYSGRYVRRRRLCTCGKSISTLELPIAVFQILAAPEKETVKAVDALNIFIAEFNSLRRAMRALAAAQRDLPKHLRGFK